MAPQSRGKNMSDHFYLLLVHPTASQILCAWMSPSTAQFTSLIKVHCVVLRHSQFVWSIDFSSAQC